MGWDDTIRAWLVAHLISLYMVWAGSLYTFTSKAISGSSNLIRFNPSSGRSGKTLHREQVAKASMKKNPLKNLYTLFIHILQWMITIMKYRGCNSIFTVYSTLISYLHNARKLVEAHEVISNSTYDGERALYLSTFKVQGI
ncbi:hypothetical protein DVH24_001553 [Malus domestica]|uniref:Uncharacterized protein n=1 Tax=Malus domestica TaxID=3750 RepID=A0A498JZI3_MALDO|nr:hypothetical protein DVH24_001553 [Malus domestica]